MGVQVVQHFQNLFDDDACAHDESMDINSKALFEEHLVDSKIAGLSPEFTKLGAPLACSHSLYRVGHSGRVDARNMRSKQHRQA